MFLFRFRIGALHARFQFVLGPLCRFLERPFFVLPRFRPYFVYSLLAFLPCLLALLANGFFYLPAGHRADVMLGDERIFRSFWKRKHLVKLALVHQGKSGLPAESAVHLHECLCAPHAHSGVYRYPVAPFAVFDLLLGLRQYAPKVQRVHDDVFAVNPRLFRQHGKRRQSRSRRFHDFIHRFFLSFACFYGLSVVK